ncbi:hypothetical protein B9Z40_11440 [Limnohabitans sp. 15K]|nr:hypothetical protein B9Z40_11440 [Limnohabitans sp. 15K]
MLSAKLNEVSNSTVGFAASEACQVGIDVSGNCWVSSQVVIPVVGGQSGVACTAFVQTLVNVVEKQISSVQVCQGSQVGVLALIESWVEISVRLVATGCTDLHEVFDR